MGVTPPSPSRIFAGNEHLKFSRNDFDWLGQGIYFWENSPSRALDYAVEQKHHPRNQAPRVTNPAVVGAVIELGYCLNLLDAAFLTILRKAYDDLKLSHESIGVPLPENKMIDGDLLVRRLDCAVINAVHQTRDECRLQPFDTVRSAFAEGSPL